MAGTFVRRERKHRRIAKQKSPRGSAAHADVEDANRDVVVPESSSAKDARRKQLQAELIAQSAQGKVSGKKRKRLDHYIETKLKREENAELIRRLAAQQVDTSLLQSSKTLGRVADTKRDALTKALREHKAGIDTSQDSHAILFQRPRRKPEFEAGSDDDLAEVDSNEQELDGEQDSDQDDTGRAALPCENKSAITFGSGLKRSRELDTGVPLLIKRRKRRKKASRAQGQPSETGNESEDAASEWGGFDGENEHDLRQDGSVVHDDTSDDDTDSDGISDGDGETSNDSQVDVDDDDSTSSISDHGTPRAARSSAFKQWAEMQRNDAYGFQPSTAPVLDPSILATIHPRQPSPDLAAAAALQISSTTEHQRQLRAIVIERSQEIQALRERLPVVQEEQRIMEAIKHNPIVIVCGATGSGKTTQVPQMMLEGGYASNRGLQTGVSDVERTGFTQESLGMIGVTQPRRVAALSVAERVKTELGSTYSSRVAHHVRYDTNVSEQTALKFMTDGILLRELHQDFILSKYSAIMIDEAHERSVNTDILIGTLSRVVTLREELTREDPTKYYPLRLIIMSATLRVADFVQNSRLFPRSPPPILEVEGRQFDVTIHFARRTQRDYEAEMVKKISRGHRKLPPGTILAFLPGQNEITSAMKQLQQAIGNSATVKTSHRTRITADQQPLENEDMDLSWRRDEHDHVDDEDDADIVGLDGDGEDDYADFNVEVPEDIAASRQTTMKVQILPLYAALPSDQQMQVFKPAPPDTRLIILATNVAETSLTIPGVRYVFDCGRSKEKKYDNSTGISTFEVDWISKASAAQRTGRAGRTGPGHCWRLYSSALYEEHFPEHSIPEILRTPVENVVLQLRAMDIDNIPNFPFPTAPDRQQLRAAERLLSHLGALQSSGRLTEHGRELMQYPISPRFGKILLLAARNNVVEHALALVAALAVGEIFLPDVLINSTGQSDEDVARHTHGRAQALLSRWDDQSDAIKMLTAVAAHAEAAAKSSTDVCNRLSQELHLREKSMTEVQLLRRQLRGILDMQSVHAKSTTRSTTTTLPLASSQQRKMLNQIVAAAFLDHIAIRADMLPGSANATTSKPRRSIEVPYIPLFPIDPARPTDPVFVHSSSVLARLSKDEMPGYVVYSHLSRAAAKTISDDATVRVRMHPLTSISGKALAALAQDTPLLQVGKPIGKIEEQDGGKRRTCWVSMSLRPSTNDQAGVGGSEWPLSAWHVEQVRSRKGEWQIVKVLSR